ncbi:hypothetical protein QBC38DRAFT_363798 [Podospora fimiseda]|uniref:Uncharacterized protein n=1 Tax=Podospora fimiseda TaxID=252190 RepID=A0AAN7H2V9_9PEZI|nr:hypothetical protein QBC38DRAFT_363798 [Podospora fimiseda]
MSTLTETLNFLTDAGHLLAHTSPEISGYLMSQRSGLMLENGLEQSEVQRQHVCDRCGHTMIGNQSIVDFKSFKKIKKKKSEPRKFGPTKIITCGRCDLKTQIKIPAPAPISKRIVKNQKTTKATPSLLDVSQDSQKANSNANSKKRAKSRKAGLQALLEQSKSSRPAGLGLSLADFMSK